MKRPRLTIRRLMILVLLSALLLTLITPPLLIAWKWLHDHDAWISVGPFTVQF